MLAELWPQISAALRGYLRGANWRELLISGADILIVYYVIYRVLRLIRGTRAAQMLVGMGLVAMVYVAAKSLQLTTVSWLFENLLNYVIIFMIVIFQHDIRRGLMQVGQNLYRRRQYEESYVIEEVVQAADHLSRHRIGGLIVLEREADPHTIAVVFEGTNFSELPDWNANLRWFLRFIPGFKDQYTLVAADVADTAARLQAALPRRASGPWVGVEIWEAGFAR